MRMVVAGQHVLFLLLLGYALVAGVRDGVHPVAVGVVGTLDLCWYLFGIVLARSSRSARSGWWWFLGLAIGWAVLLWLTSQASWMVIPMVFLALHTLPDVVARIVVGVLTVVVVVVSMGASRATPWRALGPALGIVISVAAAVLYQQVAADNVERARLIDELVATQDDLIAAQGELAASQRRAGMLAERSRLARDIHDTLAQSFSAITLLARGGLQRADGDERELLEQIERTSSAGLQDARRVVHALSPAELDGTPLSAALRRQVDRLAEQTSIDAGFELVGEPTALPTAWDVALLRFTQGALSNVRIHSHATRARVTLSYEPDQVRVDVVDDGTGMEPARPSPVGRSGFGLEAMRQRLAEVGGRVEIESTPGAGTAVVAIIGLEAADAAGSPEEES